MANIPYWQTTALFRGKLSDLLALRTQGATPYPVLNWSSSYDGHTETYKKLVSWTTPRFAFWNFVHPANADIYKYYDKPNKRVFQRKWNREHWGSAYEISQVITSIIHESSLDKIANSMRQYTSIDLPDLTDVSPDSTEYVFVVTMGTEDRPSTIFEAIGKQYPDVTATILQSGEYGWQVKRLSMASGVLTVEAEQDRRPDTHDEFVLYHGACKCETSDYQYHWPTECVDRKNKEQEQQQAVLASMMAEG